MITKLRLNNDRNKEYKIRTWSGFSYTTSVIIYDASFENISRDFAQIERFDVIQESGTTEIILGTFTNYNTYEEISFIRDQFIEALGTTTQAYKVKLAKSDISTLVERLDAQINPVIDTEKMGLEELRQYTLHKISEQCQAEIYQGMPIQLTDGSIKQFSYKEQDQTNLKSLFDLIMMNPLIEALPYHADATSCEMLSRADIIIIYTTLLFRLTERVTWANTLNIYVRGLETREELEQVSYDMTLPESSMENYHSIMNQTSAEMEKIVGALKERMNPSTVTDESAEVTDTDTDESDEVTNTTDD